MPSTYSSLKFELIATGEQAGTWGNTTNINIGTAIEEAITGSATVTFTSGANAAIALTNTNAAQTARNLRLDLSGTMTTSQYLYVPAIEKFYIINNTLSNTVIVSNGSNAAATGTAVSVPRSTSVMLFNDGVNVTSAISHIPSLANVTISSGNVTVTNLTATTGNVTTGNIASLTVTSNATIAGVSVTSGNATLTNLTATTANLTNANVTSVLTVAAGTNAAPAITTSGDTNTGIFFPAADTIAFAEGGAEAMRIDSSGNLLVGDTSSLATLYLKTPAQTGDEWEGKGLLIKDDTTANSGLALYSRNSVEHYIASLADDATSYLILGARKSSSGNQVNVMTLRGSGNVGIGTNSPGSKLTVSDANVRVRFTNTSGTASNLVFGSDSGVVWLGNENNQPMYFVTNNTERARITSGGIFLIGTATASGGLGAGGLEVTDRIAVGTGSVGTPSLHCNTDTNTGLYFPGADILGFATGGTERARITSGGDFLVGTTVTTVSVKGAQMRADGLLAAIRDGDAPLVINRLTNDGTLVSFSQATTEEGTISVSGTTVSYNGGHLARWSQLLSGQRDEAIVKGTVLSNLDEMCEWLDAEGNPLPNEQLNRMKVSDVEGDTNVAGVFVNWDNDDQDNPYDMNIAMTGDMIIRIAQGVTVQKGDLLMSAGDGTAKPQGDDIARSKTVAKVTSNHVTCTYEDGSYCVPCVLMAC